MCIRDRPVAEGQEVGFVAHLERHAAVVAAAVGEVGVDEYEVAVVGHQRAPLAVVVIIAQPLSLIHI